MVKVLNNWKGNGGKRKDCLVPKIPDLAFKRRNWKKEGTKISGTKSENKKFENEHRPLSENEKEKYFLPFSVFD